MLECNRASIYILIDLPNWCWKTKDDFLFKTRSQNLIVCLGISLVAHGWCLYRNRLVWHQYHRILQLWWRCCGTCLFELCCKRAETHKPFHKLGCQAPTSRHSKSDLNLKWPQARDSWESQLENRIYRHSGSLYRARNLKLWHTRLCRRGCFKVSGHDKHSPDYASNQEQGRLELHRILPVIHWKSSPFWVSWKLILLDKTSWRRKPSPLFEKRIPKKREKDG